MSMQSSDNNWKVLLEWWLELQERHIERRALLTTEGLTTEGLAFGSGSGIKGETEVSYVYACMDTFIYTNLYIHIYIYIHTFIYVCIYIYIYILISFHLFI
jgi:hypothetical protein